LLISNIQYINKKNFVLNIIIMKRKQMEPIESIEPIEVVIDENFLNGKRRGRFEKMFEELFNENELLNILWLLTGLKKQSVEYLIE